MKTKTKETWLFIVVLLSGIFFILFKYQSIPPVIHFDQITPFISSELKDLGEIDLSLRSQIFNIINFITPLHRLIPYFRYTGSFDLIDLTLKLPAMIMFLLSIPVWHLILKELNVKSKWVFWIIFLTSPVFILYSKFVPTTAGFFLYSSLSTLFLLKSFNPKISNGKFFFFFVLAILFATVSFYTHIISVVYSAIIFSYFLLFYKENGIAKRFKVIDSSFKGFFLYLFFTISSILIILGVGYLNLQKDTSVLENRSRYSVATIFAEKNNVNDIASSIGTRALAALDPRFLVSGTNQTLSTSPKQEFSEFLNPNQSIWLTQLVGPFGIVGAVIYLALMILLFQKGRGSGLSSLVYANLFAYLALSVLSLYDNPSPARTLPALMFIPLGILALYESMQDNHLKIFKSLMAILICISSIYTISVFYSRNYERRETAKYETGVKEISNILSNGDLANSKVFINSTTWSQDRYLQIYLGTNIVNRIIPFTESATVLNAIEDTSPWYVITDNKNLAKEISSAKNIVFETKGRYLFGESKNISHNKVILTNSFAYNVPLAKVNREEEYDVYQYQEPVYEKIGKPILYSNAPRFPVKTSLLPFINLNNDVTFKVADLTGSLQLGTLMDLKSNELTVDGLDDGSIMLSSNSLKLQSNDTSKTIYISIISSNTYYYLINYRTNKDLELSVYDYEQHSFIPVRSIKSSNSDLHHVLINPSINHKIILNFTLPKVNSDAIIEDFGIYPINNIHAKYLDKTLGQAQTVYPKKLSITSNECALGYLVINTSYDPHLRIKINDTMINEKPFLVNGIVNGWEIPTGICNQGENKLDLVYKW